MTVEEMEKRLRLLEDIEEIKKLHETYVYTLSSRQWDAWLDCFAEDAVADIQMHSLRRGKKEIEKLIWEDFDKLPKTPGHLVEEPMIKVDGDRAKAHWILYLFRYTKPFWIQGRHECEYVKVNGRWKFSLVRFKRPWPPLPQKE
ncbi:MAG: nuclear transport factor 2 family protein [Dehalococcoidales bacterium]|nr:nuclear transport factor 2 family protein [Dehalococcoidales bacterium]